jgi:hypothetical protein
MNLTRDNYESFAVDFLEGNLNADQIDQFLDFLNQNPDLKEEMQLFECVSLPEEEIVFSGKKQLYKSNADSKSIHENRAIAYLEGDLAPGDRKLFEEDLIRIPELKKQYELFVKTRLIPNPEEKYTEKRKLHRKSGTVILMNWLSRAAAVILLVWGIGSLLPDGNTIKQEEGNEVIADVTPKIVTPEIKAETLIEEPILLAKKEKVKNEEVIILKDIQKPSEEKLAENTILPERDSIYVSEITPKLAQLEGLPSENQLVNSQSAGFEKIYDAPKVVSLDEFLVDRAKKISNEGLLSAQKIARAGLDAASELSGERIGFVEKDGKISKIEFESRLLAFSIPLKKK